jgi:hypothetical protein
MAKLRPREASSQRAEKGLQTQWHSLHNHNRPRGLSVEPVNPHQSAEALFFSQYQSPNPKTAQFEFLGSEVEFRQALLESPM